MPPLREACADAPPELEAIVAGLLEPDPERRIADAALLTSELELMSAFRGWEWTLPALTEARKVAGATRPGSDVTHAQVFDTMDAGAQSDD